ncbi:hypothetical protein ACFLZG_07425, partial [Thermodesulfobacteriota bacterium]
MDKPLTVLTALREIRRELDEWEWGDQRAKKPDEILNKYLEWVGTDLILSIQPRPIRYRTLS